MIDKLEFKDYIFEFYREEPKVFINNSNIKYICIIIIKDKLGTALCTIKVSDIEICNFIDNLYFYLEYNRDTMYSFSIDNTNIFYTIGLFKDIYSKDFLNIFSSNSNSNTTMHLLCRIDITDKVIDLIDKLYIIYIVDSNINYDTIFDLNPNLHFIFPNPDRIDQDKF